MYSLILNYGDNNPGASLATDKEVICCHFENEFVENSNWQLVFPAMSIAAVLKEKNIVAQQIRYVAFCYKPFSYLEKMIEKHLFLFPRSFSGFVNEFKDLIANKLSLKDLRKFFGFEGPVYYVDPFSAILYAAINSGTKCDFIIISLKDNPGAVDLAGYKKDDNQLLPLFELTYPSLPLLEGLETGTNRSKRLSIDKILKYKKNYLSFKRRLFLLDNGNIILRKDFSLLEEEQKNNLILNFLKDLLGRKNIPLDKTILFLSDYELPESVKNKLSEKYRGLLFIHKDKADIIRDVCYYLASFVNQELL